MFIIKTSSPEKGIQFSCAKDEWVGCDLENFQIGDDVWFNWKNQMYQGTIEYYTGNTFFNLRQNFLIYIIFSHYIMQNCKIINKLFMQLFLLQIMSKI